MHQYAALFVWPHMRDPHIVGDLTEAADIVFCECALPRNDVTHLHRNTSLDVNMLLKQRARCRHPGTAAPSGLPLLGRDACQSADGRLAGGTALCATTS